MTTPASTVTTIVGSTRRVTLTIPATISVTTPTPYLVSLTGTTTTNASFASSNTAALTVNPAAKLLSISPATGVQGKTVSVMLTGQYTNYVQGSTTANLGAGIAVGGAAEGAAGPVTVTSSTSATAQVVIDPAAATGTRNVTVATGVQQATLTNGFTVNGPPVISSLNPSSALQGQANVPVVVTGQFTHFVAGTTTVSFGAGITVASVVVTNLTTLTANISVPANAAAGPYTVTVTTGTETASLTNGFTVQAGPPTITLTAPTNLSFLNISPTTVNGTVSDATATVVINSIPAPVANGMFSIQLPLAEGPNLIVATATSATSGLAGTASIQVTLDTTPPHVTITSPTDQFVTTASSISVAGSVNDIVVGTVNAQQATVTVNGTAAQVSNRTFLVSNIPLNLGANTIQAVAVDQAGNAATTQITVTRQAPTSQPQIQLISGNNQSGVIGSGLTSPLVVALSDSSGNPVANTPVIFKVIQNNGMVAVSNGVPASSVVATTNGQGQAQVQWTLGMRAGAGSDSVEAYAVGFSGTAVFTATSTQGVAGMIVIDSGNNQIGAIGVALPKPLIAVVIDAGNNRLPNVPVTFTVQQGGGTLTVPSSNNFTPTPTTAGSTTATTTSDSDGRVAVTLTLGFQEGNANNLVTADFTGDTGAAALFAASGRAPGVVANTTISGVVLDNSSVPIPGVTIRAVLTNLLTSNSGSVNAAATVQTNAQGQFTITQAPVGFVKLLVDGSTATVPGTYPTLDYDTVTIAGQNNTLDMPIYLLPLNAANSLCVTATTGGGTLTIPEAPGFSLTFGPGQVTFPGGSQAGCVSVTVVHPDRVPMQPGFGQQPRFIVTIQPAGAIFNPPAPIALPNVDGLAPRQVAEMYSFDHDIGSFVAIGTGTVSDDGQVLRSNQGVGVLKAGWHCGGNPTQGGTAATCPVCFFCPGALGPCMPQGNGTACGNGGTCQFTGVGPVCNCPTGQVFNPTTGTCVNNGPCSTGFTLNGGQCCQGTTCVPPSCPPGLVFDPTTGTCANSAPCTPGFTLNNNGQCCQGTTCVPPSCPPGLTFNPTTGTCTTGTCGNCSSGNPCINASCGMNNQCVSTPNQLCQNACNGATSGSCSVGGVTGMCDASGNCNLCGSLGAGASCSCGSGGVGMCSSSGQCTINGQSCAGPSFQLTISTTSDPPPPALPPAGLHSFVGCSFAGSGCLTPTDTITATASATAGQISNLMFQGPNTASALAGLPQNTLVGPTSITFSGLSNRAPSNSGCAGFSSPNFPPCSTQPVPALAYTLTASADVGGMQLNATLPTGEFIQQDPVDVLRQEYLDFGDTAFSLFPWPGQVILNSNSVPSRNQIVPPSDPLFNWGFFQAATPNYFGIPGLIAINGPGGADIMGPLLNTLTTDFDILARNLDIQMLPLGTATPNAIDPVVVTRSMTLYDVTTNGNKRPFTFTFTGATDPQGSNLCDGSWADVNGNPYKTDANGNPVKIPPATTPPANGYACVGNILAGTDANGFHKAQTSANNRTANFNGSLRDSITSAYRNPQKQYDVNSASINSFHTQGRALDISPSSIMFKTDLEERCILQATALPTTAAIIDPSSTLGWMPINAVEVFSEKGTTFYPCNAAPPAYPSETDHVHLAQ